MFSSSQQTYEKDARGLRMDEQPRRYGGGEASRQRDDAHRICWMVTQRLKSGSGGRRGEEYVSDKVCRSLSGDDKTACKFFVRAFGDDLMEKLDQPIDQICDELDYGKTSPSRLHDQSDSNKRSNVRGGENARRMRGGDSKRDSAPIADLDEGARSLTVSRARQSGGSSAGLNKSGRSMPMVDASQQKEVGWNSTDPHEEGHPAASSGRAGAKGLGVNREGQ